MEVATVQLPEDWLDHIDSVADEHNTSRAAVLRSVIDNGLRAPKYYSDEFPILPEEYERPNAVELRQKGELPR
jgi:hypothetical protein